jgi:hypothetical protein
VDRVASYANADDAHHKRVSIKSNEKPCFIYKTRCLVASRKKFANHSTRQEEEQQLESQSKTGRYHLRTLRIILRRRVSLPARGDKMHDAMNNTKDQDDKNDIA